MFEKFIKETEDATSIPIDQEPPAKHPRIPPTAHYFYHDNSSFDDQSENQEDRLKRSYYELINAVLSSLATHFDQEGIKILSVRN